MLFWIPLQSTKNGWVLGKLGKKMSEVDLRINKTFLNILFFLFFINVYGPILNGFCLISHWIMGLIKNVVIQIPIKLIFKKIHKFYFVQLVLVLRALPYFLIYSQGVMSTATQITSSAGYYEVKWNGYRVCNTTGLNFYKTPSINTSRYGRRVLLAYFSFFKFQQFFFHFAFINFLLR